LLVSNTIIVKVYEPRTRMEEKDDNNLRSGNNGDKEEFVERFYYAYSVANIK